MHKKFRIYLPWIGLLFTGAATLAVLTGQPVDALVWSALLIVTIDAALLRGRVKKLVNRERTRKDNGGYAQLPITIRGGEQTKLMDMGVIDVWVANHCHFGETNTRRELIVELVTLGIERITPALAVPHLRARGYRGATAQELFAFVLKYPETNCKNEILAVGEMPIVDVDSLADRNCILGYRRAPMGSEVVSYWIGETRSANVMFLAVPLDVKEL